MAPTGKLLVFTAPSGAGKTSIVRFLLKNDPRLAFSISACTREQRYGEVNGLDYYFISVKEFREKIKREEFLEWQEVYENQLYGTLRSEVERLWALGKHVVFDIDVKGALNLKKLYGADALLVFVKPPTPEILFERLRNRRTEDEASLRKRIARAAEELEYEHRCDVVLVNDVLEEAQQQALALVDGFIRSA
jgi:guanylate kinase